MDIQIISASAGSGKTYRLAELLEKMVRDKEVRPDAILATTFTKKAAAELQERVRTKLLAAELATQAQQLSVSRIGTVNSVCGGLLTDFAFDLGISPDQKVIEEEVVTGVINRALSRVINKAVSKELWQLEQVIPGLKPRKVIENIIAKARANGLGGKDLLQCCQKSAEEFTKLLGNPAATGSMLDQALHDAMEIFLKKVDTETDSTKVTKEAIETVRRLKSRLHYQKFLPWDDWSRLARLKIGAKSKAAAESLHIAAACHDNHPQLHQNVIRLITLVFELAAKSLDEYQKYKREWGVVDFTDQEALTLKLLNMEKPAQILSDQLDLVLVDEFQDTSPIQLAIFLKLASLAKKSVWVGDQKQAIYGFRDADPSLMDAAITGILKEEEPDTLPYSWRSRPELVCSTSDIFVKAFVSHDFPERRVRLEPAATVMKNVPQGLSPVYECWQLESKNKENDALALADSVRNFLADPENSIRDPKTGQKRRARGGDVAILCRKNDDCLEVAKALEQQGIEAALPRPGLLSCPEVVLTLASVRLLIESNDSLAKAEIARLLDDPANHEAWLQKALAKPYAQGFDLEIFSRLDQTKKELNMAGPLQILDEAMEAAEVRSWCLAWGHSKDRLANLDSLRSLCVRYVEECRSSGHGASSVGMLVHLKSLKSDTRAVVQNEETVQVLTWHKAKGLEWPVTVLFQLEKVFKALPLGVSVASDEEFTLENPLANRWIRYWPDPYASKSKFSAFSSGAPFHERLAEHPVTLSHTEKEMRQELRLLYVGWTRARDKVVLAGRAGFLEKGIMRLLVDEDQEHLLKRPENNKAIWAGQPVDITMRIGIPAPPVEQTSVPGTGYMPGGVKEYPPAFLAASSKVGQGTGIAMEKIGDRIAIAGKPDMQALGEALHTFLGADYVKRDTAKRFTMATNVLKRWQTTANMTPESLLLASDHLHAWVTGKWQDAIWHREYPVALRQEDGTIVSGFIDLLLELPDCFVIIDHKSFPGSSEEAQKKAARFAGQLGVYAEAVQEATGKEVIGCYIHLPVSGMSLCIV
jgi:ATP-dependent exoDNAse (exonuclease V) beta subunit